MTKAYGWMDLKYLYAIVSRGEVPIWIQNFGWLLNWSLFDRLKLVQHNLCNFFKKGFSILNNNSIFHTNGSGNKIHLIFRPCYGGAKGQLMLRFKIKFTLLELKAMMLCKFPFKWIAV
jgi:hypothetical protein